MNDDIPTRGAGTGGRSGLSSVMALALLSATIVAVGMGVGAAVLLIGPGPGPAEGRPAQETRREMDYTFVSFGTVVVNLKGERMTRFLQASLSVKIDAVHRPHLDRFMDRRKVVFQNWLITHLSDKFIEDVEGAAALRRLQREIEDGFNAILADMGQPFKIEAVLFEEFNVQ